jgi:hypothetical protein
MSQRRSSLNFLIQIKEEVDHKNKNGVSLGLAIGEAKVEVELHRDLKRAHGLEFQEPLSPDLVHAPPKSQGVQKRVKHGLKSRFLKLHLLNIKLPKTTMTCRVRSDKNMGILHLDTRVILSITSTSSAEMTDLQGKRYSVNTIKVGHHNKTFLRFKKKLNLTKTHIMIAARNTIS